MRRSSDHPHWRSLCRISALAGCCLLLVLAAFALGLRQGRAGISLGDASAGRTASSKALVSGGRNGLHALTLVDEAVPVVGIPVGIPLAGINGSDLEKHVFHAARTNQTAAEIVGAHANSRGDLDQFLASLVFYTGSAIAYFCAFCFMRRAFPAMYTMGAGVQAGLSPGANTLLGWLQPTLTLKMEGLEAYIGLDYAMLLEFMHLCIKLFACISIPMVIILCPLHVLFGTEDVDRLSKFSMASLQEGSRVYWVHVIAVWVVVVIVQRFIYDSQIAFVSRRYQWCIDMPEPRVSTLMVFNIPQRYRSDELLKRYLQDRLFTPDQIRDVAIVKKTDRLKEIVHQLKLAKTFSRHSSKHLEEGCLPRFMRMFLRIPHPPAASIEDLQQQFDHEMQRINRSAREVEGINTAIAFVTFSSVREKEFARQMQFSENPEEWTTLNVAAPDHVHWDHLAVDHRPACQACSKSIGWLCVVLLFLGFGPIVTSISTAGAVADQLLKDRITWVPLRHALGGILPTAGLALFTSFLPSVLMLIFRSFFQVASEALLQQKLQRIYFWFQVIFVLLVPAVGSSLLLTVTELIKHPGRTGTLLAKTLPTCSHFYLTYNILHLATTCLNLTRYWQFLVYLWHRRGHEPEIAAQLAEPEDQDYYGIGSRSARWSIYAMMGLFFCQLDPIIGVLSLLNFLLCRLSYGYLLVFAERRKLDTGGRFWVDMLWGLQYGMIIYVILMNGVLLVRAGSDQAFVCFCSLIYLLRSIQQFAKIAWHKLPLEFMKTHASGEKLREQCGSYIQPELLDQSETGTYTYTHLGGKGYSAIPSVSREPFDSS